MANEQTSAAIIMEAVTPADAPKPKIVFVKDQKDMFYCRFEAVLQTFNCWNRNKRFYDGDAMWAGIQAPHLEELRRFGTWVGENGHPDTDSVQRTLSIDPKSVCHRIIGCRREGDVLYGTIETLNDDGWGKQMTKHILQGLVPSFSLRALAPLTKTADGRTMCKSQPHIVTYDRVILPSHKEAYMNTGAEVSLHRSEEGFIPQCNTYADSSMEITNEAALSYIRESSLAFKDIISNFDVEDGSIKLIENGTKVIFKDAEEPNVKYVTTLESFVTTEVARIFKDIRHK